MAKKMFDLPMEDKMKAPHPDGFVPHRGYSPPGKEKVYKKDELETNSTEVKESIRKITEFKEHYEIGSEDKSVHYNIWLPEEVLPGFQAYETQLFWYLHQVSMAFLDTLLLGLEMNGTAKDDFKALDSGSFTILFQDDASGLEFGDNNNKGNFLPATPAPGKIYLNIGDMFEIFSNVYYPSAMHRVSIPSKPGSAETTPARYSIPFFIISSNDASIKPQSSGRPGQMPTGKFSRKSWNEQAQFITKWQYEKDKGIQRKAPS